MLDHYISDHSGVVGLIFLFQPRDRDRNSTGVVHERKKKYCTSNRLSRVKLKGSDCTMEAWADGLLRGHEWIIE